MKQIEQSTLFYRSNTAMAVSVIFSVSAVCVRRANFQVSESYLQKYGINRDCLNIDAQPDDDLQ